MKKIATTVCALLVAAEMAGPASAETKPEQLTGTPFLDIDIYNQVLANGVTSSNPQCTPTYQYQVEGASTWTNGIPEQPGKKYKFRAVTTQSDVCVGTVSAINEFYLNGWKTTVPTTQTWTAGSPNFQAPESYDGSAIYIVDNQSGTREQINQLPVGEHTVVVETEFTPGAQISTATQPSRPKLSTGTITVTVTAAPQPEQRRDLTLLWVLLGLLAVMGLAVAAAVTQPPQPPATT